MISTEHLSIRAKFLGFRLYALGKQKYRLTKEGVIGGGYQGKISECLAYLDGWQAAKDIPLQYAHG